MKTKVKSNNQFSNLKALKYAKEMQRDYGLNGKQFIACYKDADLRIKKHKPLNY